MKFQNRRSIYWFFKVSGEDRLIFKDKLIDYCENKKQSILHEKHI